MVPGLPERDVKSRSGGSVRSCWLIHQSQARVRKRRFNTRGVRACSPASPNAGQPEGVSGESVCCTRKGIHRDAPIRETAEVEGPPHRRWSDFDQPVVVSGPVRPAELLHNLQLASRGIQSFSESRTPSLTVRLPFASSGERSAPVKLTRRSKDLDGTGARL